MAYDVVVVGGGIGGLTAAALLSARGMKVCLFEKEAQAGGCAAGFEKFGYTFETTASLYASWQPGEIHERVFAELPVQPPEVRRVKPAYTVRLPDQTQIPISENDEEFEESLHRSFPECAQMAVSFYRELAPLAESLQRVAQRVPDLPTASKLRRMKAVAPEAFIAPRIYAAMNDSAAKHLTQTSTRFRRFIDAQLLMFAQRDNASCAYLYAAIALCLPRRGMYEIRGGAPALVYALVEAIRKSGGTVRLNTPVLRLAYDSSGQARGVDLLTGERVEATRAIISNLTVWDTYGRLVGLNSTPAEIRSRLKKLHAWGAYLLFLGLDEETAQRLPSAHILALNGEQQTVDDEPPASQLMFAAAPAWDTRGPAGKRAVTVAAFTDPEQWFAFHQDESEHEGLDQSWLEACWERLHAALPELGSGIEVIETATPRTFYENTRRKLGMVGGVGQSLDVFGPNSLTHRTFLPNLYMVGDSTFPGNGVAAVTQSALIVANELARPARK
ncbi:MAG TPA: NAD(P)/FAD-dependent oxidoreductase [Pyrinomonadaceae bacterium]|jgi:C-3',4' desaturase CrtD